MIRRSVFSIAAVLAIVALSAPSASAQSAGAERCSPAGRVEVYTCKKDGATQRCEWTAQAERRCPLPASTKATAVTLPAAATPTMSPTTSAVRDARAANPAQPPSAGPAPSVSSNDTRNSSADRAAAIRAGVPTTDANKSTIDAAAARLTGAAAATSSVSSQLTDAAKKTDRPDAINATTKPQVDPGAVGRIGGNPMGVVGGTSVSGPLAESAARSSGVTSIADLGKGLIMKPPGVPMRANDANTPGVSPIKTTKYDDTEVATYPDGSREGCFLSCENESFVYSEKGNEKYYGHYAGGQLKFEVLEVTLSDGSNVVIRRHYDEKDRKWNETLEHEPAPPAKASAGRPADECQLAGRCGAFNSAVLDAQRDAMRRAAVGSTINPDRNSDGFVSPCKGQGAGVVSSDGGGGGGGGESIGSVNQSSSRCGQDLSTTAATSGLVTNPGVAGGLGSSGGPAMQDRTFTTTTGAGVITPTNDQNISGQGRQDDPGDFFGKKPTAGALANPLATSDKDKDKEKEKEKEKNSDPSAPK